ncbi:MAG: alpha/beta hydrolase [Anaerolineae bacterium]|nr:alpha/beta hydrolase [Anaerolineae bacterium]
MSAHDFFVTAGDLHFHVCDWGGQEHPPLLMLHGLASTVHMFDLIAPALTDRFHVFAFDQRGHGLSEKPDDGYDFETIAQDVDRVLQALQLGETPPTLIGHSWGAYTSLYYATTRPDRLAKVALIDGGLRSLQSIFPTWAEAEIGMAPPTYDHVTTTAIRRMIREDWLGAIYRPELEPLALSVFDLSDEGDVRPHLSREHHMQIAHHVWAFNPADYFGRVQCPLLSVNAVGSSHATDPDIIAGAETAQQRIVKVEIVWLEDTVHDIPWQRPAELVAILQRFL